MVCCCQLYSLSLATTPAIQDMAQIARLVGVLRLSPGMSGRYHARLHASVCSRAACSSALSAM